MEKKAIKLQTLQKAVYMSNYVSKMEELVNLHPIAKSGLIEKPIESKNNGATGRQVECLSRLEDVNNKIQQYFQKKNKKLKTVIDKYGSVEKFRQFVQDMQAKASEDMEEFLKERERQKKFAEAKARAKNKKDNLQDKLRTERWISNYENTVKEII